MCNIPLYMLRFTCIMFLLQSVVSMVVLYIEGVKG